MANAHDQALFEALVMSWDRNNTILLNLLRAVPPGGLAARATEGGPTVAQHFSHVHSVRLAFVKENAPDFAVALPEEEWLDDHDPQRIAARLDESAGAVRDAVTDRLESGQPMGRHFDHPILLFQMMIWHEGYHHGQIKLALKVSGQPLADQDVGRLTWGVWMRKTKTGGIAR